MIGKCGECRLYNGFSKKCKRNNGGKNPSSNGCSWFTSNFKTDTRTCKDCEYYNAVISKCKLNNGGKNPSSSCSYFKAYR